MKIFNLKTQQLLILAQGWVVTWLYYKIIYVSKKICKKCYFKAKADRTSQINLI